MNADRQQAIDYFRAPADGLWRWAENGGVVIWRDSTTIAFREEIVRIIECLAPNGLPSFGAIVFLLAACRGKLPSVADIVTTSHAPLPPAMGKDAVVLTTARQQVQVQLAAAIANLSKVSKLPSELNSGLNAKCVLAEAVFEPAKVERHVDARAVLRGLNDGLADADLTDSETITVRGNYLRQVAIVSEGLKHHTPETLALRMQTGLDALPTETDAQLPIAERARRLIDDLSRDPEHGALARAAKELMAAVRLPRRLGERDQLAIGGVADITNRGPLDRLLLSELAHDDLTLSVRVALNEALYLRREPPMREPPGTLAVLLDSGLRLWGVPRVLATAVALALVAGDKQHSSVTAWRGQGKKLQPVDLLTRKGIAEHLAALEPAVHVGDSVPAFAGNVAEGERNQSVLITHPDALADPDFRRALSENPGALEYVATVDRDGRFELHAMPLTHRSAICEANLDLTAIFEEKTALPPIRTEVDPDLPAIFGVLPFPFLLPVSGKVDCWTQGEDKYYYAVLNDRRMVQFRDMQQGARVLASDLPGGKTLWVDGDGAHVHAVKVGASQRPARLLSVELPYGLLRVTDLSSGPEIKAVHRYGDVILAIRSHDVRAYSLGDGRLLGQITNPHHWVSGRYFRGTRHFYFAVWDGERVKFEQVPIPSAYLVPSVALIFDREGMPGPWLLCKNGDLVCTETGEVTRLPNPNDGQLNFAAATISREGHHLMLPTAKRQVSNIPLVARIALRPEIKLTFVPQGTLAYFDAGPSLPRWNLYRVIENIAVFSDGLGICGPKGRWRKIALTPEGRLRISDLASTAGISPQRIFTQQARKTKHGCMLQTAEFTHGSKLFLDSRGLLHFKSSNPAHAEVSLVLSDGEVAGWTSDGHSCGPAFFFDGPRASEPRLVFERVMNFFANP